MRLFVCLCVFVCVCVCAFALPLAYIMEFAHYEDVYLFVYDLEI